METRIKSIIKRLKDRDIDVIASTIEEIETLSDELNPDEIRKLKQPFLAILLESMLRVIEQRITEEITECLFEHTSMVSMTKFVQHMIEKVDLSMTL